MSELRGVVGRYPHTDALFEAPKPLADGTSIAFITPDRAGGALGSIARMLRAAPGLDFDFCEVPLVNYLAARERGAAFRAIPVVLTRRFPHPTLVGNRRAGVEVPPDLEGRRVGIGYYGNTDATWARGLLAQSYGVALNRITWVTAFEEPVVGARVPPNTIHLPRADLALMLEAGELAGQVVAHGAVPPAPHLIPLVANHESEQRSWYERTGIFPPLHTVVIKDAAVQEHPTIADELFARFAEAKARRLAALATGAEFDEAAVARARMSGFPPTAADDERAYLGPDPLPYGMVANRAGLEMLIGMCVDQGILASTPDPSELFLPITGEPEAGRRTEEVT